MLAVRRLLAQRYLALVICLATVALKLVVPTGYMIGSEHGRMTIELCSGLASAPMATAMPAMDGDMPGHGTPKEHGKAEIPCAFAGMTAASLGAIPAVQLVALIAFVMAVGVRHAVLPAISRSTYLRPPLRGPPTGV